MQLNANIFKTYFTFKPEIYTEIFNHFLCRQVTKMFYDFLISVQPTLIVIVLIFLSSSNCAPLTSVLFFFQVQIFPSKKNLFSRTAIRLYSLLKRTYVFDVEIWLIIVMLNNFLGDEIV